MTVRHRRPRVQSKLFQAEHLERRQLFALTVAPLDASPNVNDLANEILIPSTGVTVTGGSYVGAANQAGTYAGLDFTSGDTRLIMDDGVLLTSGLATNALGPNSSPGAGEDLGSAGDTQLDALTNATTFDANALTLTFTTTASTKSIIFDFIFASEEFFEYVNLGFNDAFAAYLDGVQISFDADNKPITVDNNFFRLNNSGTSYGSSTRVTFPSQYDGFTPHIRTQAPLVGSGTHTLKFVIADTADHILDSAVFLTGLQGSTRVVSAPETSLPVPGRLEFAPSPSGTEASGVANIVVNRVDGSSGKVSAKYTTGNVTAIAGSDYTASTGIIEFLDGETTKTISIPITNDTLVEEVETFYVTLSNPTAGLSLPVQSTVQVSVINDDTSIQFAATTFDVAENAGVATVTVTRAGGSAGTATVSYATGNGTALAGSDYTAASGTLTFAVGETSKTFTVPVNLDTEYNEPTETILLTLTNPIGSLLVLGTPATATLNLINVDLRSPTATVDMQSNRRGITALNVQYDEAIATPTDPRSYTIWYRGIDGRNGSGSDYTYRIKSVSYDPSTHVATIVPVRRLPLNRVYQLSINSPFVTDLAGNPLDGNADGTGSDNKNIFFGRGSRLNYVDRDGDRVMLQVRNGGVIQLLRDWDGEAQSVSLVEDSGTSQVSGLVRKTRISRGVYSDGTTSMDFTGRASANAFNTTSFIQPG